jgi:hypothetical protein
MSAVAVVFLVTGMFARRLCFGKSAMSWFVVFVVAGVKLTCLGMPLSLSTAGTPTFDFVFSRSLFLELSLVRAGLAAEHLALFKLLLFDAGGIAAGLRTRSRDPRVLWRIFGALQRDGGIGPVTREPRLDVKPLDERVRPLVVQPLDVRVRPLDFQPLDAQELTPGPRPGYQGALSPLVFCGCPA